MAMNEDSVVSSLNELRQMANDRARRETESRARVEDGNGWDSSRGHHGSRRSDGRLRVSDIRETGHGQRHTMTGGFGEAHLPPPTGHAPTLMGGHAAVEQPPAQRYGYGYGYSHATQQAAMPPVVAEPAPQKSAVGPVLLTILLMGGAAAGGYWKLQQDWNATLRARDAAIVQAEEGRNRAVEAASRAEQQAKVAIQAAEEKANLAAKAPPPAPAPEAAPAAPAAKPALAAAKASKSEKSSRRGRRAAAAKKLAAARVERPAPPPPAAVVDEKKTTNTMPKLAGKKKLQDDPLAGLKL